MFSEKWEVSRRQYEIIKEADVPIPTNDSIKFDADIFRPDSELEFPAIVSVDPYEKSLQSAPIMPTGLNMVNGGIEAGDPNFYVRRDYVQVIANVRGSGKSGGKYVNYGPQEVQDTYQIIEWIANQPWCVEE
jgi:putative CocE/NonD family hydrolase